MGHDEPAIPPTVSIVMESGGIIDGGMSGSPILDEAGRVVSLVSTAEGEGKRGDLQPTLTETLPGWIVRRLGLHEAERHVTREKA